MHSTRRTARSADTGPVPAMQQDTNPSATNDPSLEQDFHLGQWLVQPRLNQLRQRTGELTRHLQPRLVKLLCYLAAHERQVVDRDTLIAVLWPRVIVNENSLTRAVSELRKQLTSPHQTPLVYIETIPKRGYRLGLPVEPTAMTEPAAVTVDSVESKPAGLQWLPVYTRAKQSVTAALCLSLLLGVWLQFHRTAAESPAADQLADELVRDTDGIDIGNALMLNSSVSPQADRRSISLPVLSRDQSRLAYIQYDHTGSTLFLGKVGGDYAPLPVFNSADTLYHLTWSPMGNALLFAGQPGVAATALFDRQADPGPVLYCLDLESLRVSRLVEQPAVKPEPIAGNELRLT